MAGTLQFSPIEWRGITLRELTITYDAFILDRWDHTATLSCMVNNLIGVVHNIFGKTKLKPKGPIDFHPYRERKRRGLKIDAENIGVLKQLGGLFARRSRK